MIRVGIVGIGFMGMVHYLTYQKLRGVQVAALCEKNKARLTGDWRDIKGNFGPTGEIMDLSGVATHTSFDELLADESIDLIDITLPPALHTEAVIKALRAGKHVFCEKPMALDPADCRRMVQAANKTGRLLLIGHVLPFFPEYEWALKMRRSGKLGRLLGGSFKRVISNPAWLKHYWSEKHVGGPMLDLHVHDAHFIRLLFGMPKTVTSRGRLKKNLAEYWHSQFGFGTNGPVVEATSGTINQQGRAFDHGFEIHYEKATLLFEFAVIGDQGSYLCPPTILTHDGKVKHPSLGSGDPMDAFRAELKEVVGCISGGRESDKLNGNLAQDALRLCQKQTQSLRTGRIAKL
ncbi:MAG: Gfo/Idh/MocA family oxidoreductase [Planctomycetota bacterium]